MPRPSAQSRLHSALSLPPAVVQPADPVAAERSATAAQINLERAARGAPALRLNGSLNAAAQRRADTLAAAADPTALEDRHDVGERVDSAGYGQRLVAEIVMRGDGPIAARLDALREAEPELFAEAMRKDYRDLGVGLAPSDEGLVRVFLFGFSLADDFAEKTALLSDLAKVRQDILARVLAERKARRLPPLRESPLLDRTAQEHAEDMIRRSYYGHENPEGAGAMARAGKVGYGAVAIGENLAEGQSSVAEVMEGWMGSSVHRQHILSLELKEIGIGMAFGKNSRGYEIVWVQVFGTPAAVAR